MSTTTITNDPTSSSFWSRNWQKIVATSIWVALVGSFLGYSAITGTSPTATLRSLVEVMTTPIGPLIYILIYMVRPLAFFSAVILTLLGGALFGPVLGVIYTVIGSNLSATIAYLLGRFLGKGLIDENQTTGLIAKYTKRMRKNAFASILTMRFLYLPYDLVNYLAGFLRINYPAFILATILGSIPGTISFVLAGASVNVADIFTGEAQPSFDPLVLVASVVLFVAGIVFSRYLKQREAQKETRTLMNNTFSDVEGLKIFSSDYFPHLASQFTPETTREQAIELLVPDYLKVKTATKKGLMQSFQQPEQLKAFIQQHFPSRAEHIIDGMDKEQMTEVLLDEDVRVTLQAHDLMQREQVQTEQAS